jgi:hypothetical protein
MTNLSWTLPESHAGRIEPYGINLPARATLASSQ